MTDHIRNFCIIAHIDHGKSTLADRFLQMTHSVTDREFHDLMLDDMELERERGITIKASSVTMFYRKDGKDYTLNLIDTPGHVDFAYEVSRSLRACEGAVLLVDANQGVEAQTVATFNQALEHDLEIIPVVTKIDLPDSRPIETMEEMEHTFGLDAMDIMAVSGKSGKGVDRLLDEIIEKVPAPPNTPDEPLRGLIFDSFYDEYRGVIAFIRVVDGSVSKGDEIVMASSGNSYEALELGLFTPRMQPRETLKCGEVGYIVTGIKDIRNIKIGDTVMLKGQAAAAPLPGYVEPKPMVYCGLFPQDNDDLDTLRSALERLSLNDSSFVYEVESSDALGFGFRCGFLGLLHMEIIQERIERENDIPLIQTAPNVTYRAVMEGGEMMEIDRPAQMPDMNELEEVQEPWVEASIIVPATYMGNVMKLVESRRGQQVKTEFFSDERVMIVYELPLAEIVYDFFDKLKSGTRGYGTLDYELLGYRASDLVKVDILVNKRPVDALSIICHRSEAERRGRRIVELLRKKIERHMFAIPLQAAIGGKVIARETISAMRKDVTAKCYGGDITRKRKLMEKQKEGKKRMKSVGSVSISQEAFLTVLEGEE